jgi:hypothetical protein
MRSIAMTNLSERYRLKALASEKLGFEATDPAIKFAWADIAIAWHALANAVARTDIVNGEGLDLECGSSGVLPKP